MINKRMAFFDCLTTKKNNGLANKRNELRRQYRAARRALPQYQQYAQAKQLSATLKRCPEFKRAKHIACYLPSDGEIDPSIIHKTAWALGKRIYLPVPSKKQSLRFIAFTRHTQLVTDAWGIKQPRCATRLAKQVSLDLILVPLVAFDSIGNRLGRGGGYYDRFLSNLKIKRRKTKSLGLAHALQQVKEVPTEEWDCRLDAVITPRQVFRH